MADFEFIKKCLRIPDHQYDISISYNQQQYTIHTMDCTYKGVSKFPVIWKLWDNNIAPEESNYEWRLFKDDVLIKYDDNIFQLEYLPGDNRKIIGYLQFTRLDGKINHDVYRRDGINCTFIDIPGDVI